MECSKGQLKEEVMIDYREDKVGWPGYWAYYEKSTRLMRVKVWCGAVHYGLYGEWKSYCTSYTIHSIILTMVEMVELHAQGTPCIKITPN